MTTSAVSTKPSGSLLEDCLEIFYAPARVFERRMGKNFLLPLVILVVATLVLYFATRDLMAPAMDAQFRVAMAQAQKANPNLTAEQLEGMRGTMGKFAIVGILFGTIVGPLLVGIILWLVGKAVGARQALGDAMNVAVFAWYPKLLGFIVAAAMAAILPAAAITSMLSVTLGVGHFLNPATTSPLLFGLLGRVELFTIWETVLLGIGLKVTGRVSTGSATVAAIAMWVIGALPSVLGGLRGG